MTQVGCAYGGLNTATIMQNKNVRKQYYSDPNGKLLLVMCNELRKIWTVSIVQLQWLG